MGKACISALQILQFTKAIIILYIFVLLNGYFFSKIKRYVLKKSDIYSKQTNIYMNLKRQLIEFLASDKFKSIMIDLCIVICDFVIGYIMYHYLDMKNEDRMLIMFGVPFIICVVAYIAGLLVGTMVIESGFFDDVENRKSYGVLIFNSFLIGAFISATIMASNAPAWISISAMFLISALWFYLHWRVMKACRKADHIPQKKYRYVATILLFPLMMCTVVLTNVMASMITNTHDLAGNIVMVLLIIMVTWAVSYVPRRFVKAMMNIKMSEEYFLTFLLINYSLKVFLS